MALRKYPMSGVRCHLRRLATLAAQSSGRPPSLSQATFDIFDKLPRRSLPQGEPEIFCLDRDLNCLRRIAENN